MKTIEFRFVKEGNHYYIEVKKWWGWKTVTEKLCGPDGCRYTSRMLFAKKKNGIKYMYDREKLKPELLRFIEHPSLTVVDRPGLLVSRNSNYVTRLIT